MVKVQTSTILIGLLSAYSLLTFDLYQPSLPYITSYFNTTHSLSQLTLSIYLLVFGATQLLWGPLIDHFGRRRLLPVSLLLAVISSIACIFAPNITTLIIGRALQGFALCCSNLIAYSTARDHEDPIERAKILSYISMIMSVSPILAPILGSFVFIYFGWQANFILMGGIGFILLIQSRSMLFESPSWMSPQYSFRLKDTWNVYKNLLSSSTLWCGSMIIMFHFAAVLLSIINSSYLIIDRLGFSSLAFGIIFALNGLNIILGNYLGIWLRNRLSMMHTIYLGSCFVIIAGIAMLITSTLYGFSLSVLSFSLIANLGISITAPPTMSLVLTDFKENTGSALALINTIRILGSSILSMLTGYWIVENFNALPIGLIGTGIGAIVCSGYFKRLAIELTNSKFAQIEAAT